MRILVTGGAGFIGSHTVDALLSRGHEVRILDSLEPPVHAGVIPAYVPPDVEFIRGNLIDRTTLGRALAGVDVVYHFAAYQDYLTDFAHFYQTNTVGAALLYELIVQDRLPIRKVIIASTQGLYGEGKYRCPVHGEEIPDQRSPEQLARGDWNLHCSSCGAMLEPIWTDEAVVRPHNSYGMSKLAQEHLALALGRRYGIPTVALRYSIVQGPRQSFANAYSGALRSFAVRALSGHAPVVFEDGRQQRDFVSIHDVVRANLLALDRSDADGRAFNVGGARRVSVLELARMVIAATGLSGDPELPGLYRVGDTRHVFSDIARLRSLGWEPRVPQDAMVTEYLSWASAQPQLRDTFEPAQARMRTLGVLRPVAASP